MTNQSAKFNPDLESLRGIAAIFVLITHSIAVFSVDGQKAFWTLAWSDLTLSTLALRIVSIVFNANGAIILFFVLSGYVLALSLSASKQVDVIGYFIRRMFRLLPPMWASIVLFAGVLWLEPQLINGDGFSAWFDSVFQHVSLLKVFQNFVLADFSANPVTWTMYVEVIGSVIVLLTVLAGNKLGTWVSYLLLGLYVPLLYVFYPALTFSYLICFQVGVILALVSKSLKPSSRIACAAVRLGYLVMVLSTALSIAGANLVLLTTAGSALVVFGVANGAMGNMLRVWPFRLLGKVSYNLYLFHLPVIYLVTCWTVEQGWEGMAAVVIVVLMTIPISCLLAVVCYTFFESPSIKAGRTLFRLRLQARGH